VAGVFVVPGMLLVTADGPMVMVARCRLGRRRLTGVVSMLNHLRRSSSTCGAASRLVSTRKPGLTRGIRDRIVTTPVLLSTVPPAVSRNLNLLFGGPARRRIVLRIETGELVEGFHGTQPEEFFTVSVKRF
jgi:hypothetical protein